MRLCTSLTVLGLLALPLACTAFQPVSHAVHSAIKLCNGFDQELCNVRQGCLLWVCCCTPDGFSPHKHGVLVQAVPACSYCVSRFGEAHCFATAVTPSLPDGEFGYFGSMSPSARVPEPSSGPVSGQKSVFGVQERVRGDDCCLYGREHGVSQRVLKPAAPVCAQTCTPAASGPATGPATRARARPRATARPAAAPGASARPWAAPATRRCALRVQVFGMQRLPFLRTRCSLTCSCSVCACGVRASILHKSVVSRACCLSFSLFCFPIPLEQHTLLQVLWALQVIQVVKHSFRMACLASMWQKLALSGGAKRAKQLSEHELT